MGTIKLTTERACAFPNHVSVQFRNDRAPCDTASGWRSSTFDDQDYFPIYSGNHNGERNTCSDRHTNSADHRVFACINCHSNQSQLANQHSGEQGYSFNNNACFNCHPNGN